MTANHSPNTDLLFEHFATLATAPDGIARLRELILQLAVQGKLGTQDAGDEPASVLLEKIRKEKDRLVKEGKIKKDKPLKMSASEEPPGLLPKTWVWTHLSEVGLVNPRNYDIADDEDVSFIPMTLIPVGYKKPAQQEIKKWGEIKTGFTHFADNDVVMAKITPCFQNGKSVVLKNLKNGVGAGTTELHVFRTIKNLMNPEYVLLFLKTPEFLETGIRRMTGSAGQKRVPNEYFSETSFPLPPLAEQSRIVAKVDRFMTICDKLETQQQQERAGCLRLGTASLAGLQNAESPEEFGRQWAQVCDAFDLILDCPENVAVLRQTILQLAVQGRLVRQEPGDKPAGKLVEKIRKEKERLVKEGKIKREKPLENIKEILHKVPDAWQLCQLGEISEIIMGNSPPGDTYNSYGDGVPLINEPTEFSKLPLGKTIISQYTTQPTKFCMENDLLICVRGATTGRTNIAGFDACIGRGVAVIRSPLIQSYLNMFILTKAQQILDMGTGSTFPSISQNDLLTIPVPLPPLAEQHRIVEKVDALMALCDALEVRLKERAGILTKFTDVVVKNVGTG
ncbi:MAG: restriction endonuclease subunit S [Methanoregula sp.]|nr:restriction endonuclease subunit S [Methanoregula sp.]